MAGSRAQQAAIAISMKKAGKVPKGYHKMPDGRIMKDSAHKKTKPLAKAQKGISVKPTADSTAYYKKEIAGYDALIKSEPKTKIGQSNTNVYRDAKSKAYSNLNRQSLKGKPGYDKNGFPIKKSTTKKKG